ncbi:MAG: LysR family transcriptional regulator [Oscillatoriales cyanobacterium RM2_1_1]|nr:LysR family transcriptional regulator [Oscillatoriales cyanobacterium RM2_1_1]
MDLQRLKLSQLRALVAVADASNFGEAAAHLNLSQSTISHAIATLEAELGIVLFQRGRHGANLTPVGEKIVAQARQVQQLIDQIAIEANREKGLHGGSVRVVAFRSIATHVLPQAIAQCRQKFPEIAITLTEMEETSEMEQAVRAGRADIGFTYLPTSDEFETWELLRDEYIVLLPPDYEMDGDQLSHEQLAGFPLVMTNVSCCSQIIYTYLHKLNASLNIAYQVREDSTIVSMVNQGLGIGILPRLAAEPVPPQLQICSLPDPLERVIAIVTLKQALHPPAVYAFLDALKHYNFPPS